MVTKADAIIVKSVVVEGNRFVDITASAPRARDVAQRILRGYEYTGWRLPNDKTSRFHVLGKRKAQTNG